MNLAGAPAPSAPLYTYTCLVKYYEPAVAGYVTSYADQYVIDIATKEMCG